ncbi:bifunctional D-glycero-beta-D-manno-heptose-7-phosphate kinase/D-glycero-beta-D-manno-heptose 1-phosphate adenylyltransferase HldE [Acidihalobacter ferrooxydans]|uniref:Bifunctional protein HldE n=1 Tax=Acidihalobacter ferrooxydans TaxID=1765967 RepID=A0A1P8UG69_9GAMM|nr:bifunctional D-glycero-beta-D-manno-heptose-7-phosphate kinase/D-glycero-beta-D-manno-heptose 1-phosphate adenylyltransferase HldE [Acidihalobacter ferrooxydans]APZ42754.1 bifunctional heptose 7-phosphate kinase/heptose 1-phosphate adenyltransferase [Acidihalobacter ferrooxydans]
MSLTIPNFDRARVLVVGDLMLDRYWHGDTSRISPEAPVPVVRVGPSEERPGGAANVALNLAALGARPYLLGLTGHDEAADTLERVLTEAGVRCRFLRFGSHPTITKLRVLSRHQQLIRLDFEQGFLPEDTAPLALDYAELLDEVEVVVLSDYGKGTLAASRELIALARSQGKAVVVDPKGSDFARYRGATVITPNRNEFEQVVGRCADEATLIERGEALIGRELLGALLVTRSEEGMTLLRADAQPLTLPTHAREVFDVTGAGDTVVAALAAALAAGEDWPQAVALANLAAGIVVGKLGTATATTAELRRALHAHDEQPTGVLAVESLAQVVEDARIHGERIVMTNGCFDILHAGHVDYLTKARQLGDRLIVAVNTDESVARLKGPKRPINILAHRMAVLAGLSAVDWVVSFAEDTPERLICRLLPDVLVKGGDYRAEDVAGYGCVTAHGGEVRIIDFRYDCSTSKIVQAIRRGDAETHS